MIANPMNKSLLFSIGTAALLFPLFAKAEIRVSVEHRSAEPGFAFKSVPAPSSNDAATKAEFTLVAGDRDPNGGSLSVLHDGRLPAGEDEPSENFFFRAATEGGRLAIDLGRLIAVQQVCTYSWHTGTRAPQLYKLYASDGASPAFNAAPRRGTDPASCGWKLVASVDTRPTDGAEGGQYGVAVSDPSSGLLGQYRYLLFDMLRTEDQDPFGNTFYSEIDVIDANGPAPMAISTAEGAPIIRTFEAQGGKYRFTLDVTAAPDLEQWADTKLRPVVQEWYPRLAAMLPSEGFTAATNVTLRFRNNMGGTPAATGGARISLNSQWFRRELQREARGAVVHEMVHVVQSYGRARRVNPAATRTPGWLVEGMADYIRWFLYEPQTKGAEITARNIARAKYNSSYRITGNFLNWVTLNYDREIVRKLNAAAREGRYTEQLWKDLTGKTVQELGDEWQKANEARLKQKNADGGLTK
jgi:Peptidase of plants and bacteria